MNTTRLTVSTIIISLILIINELLLFSIYSFSTASSYLIAHAFGLLISLLTNGTFYIDFRKGNHQQYWLTANIILGITFSILLPLSFIDNPSSPLDFLQPWFWYFLIGVFCFWMLGFLFFKFIYNRKHSDMV